MVLYRLGAIADAARLGHRASGTVVTLVILGTLVIVPHAAAGWYVYTAYDTVTEVFEPAEPTDVLEPVPDEFDVPDATTGAGALAADPASIAVGQPDARARRPRRWPRRPRRTSRRGRSADASTSSCSAPTRARAGRACAPTR